MPENEKDDNNNSRGYERLQQDDKDKIDAILSYLNGMTTQNAINLLDTAADQIKYKSVVLA